jgi:hypothetical protein
LERFWLCKYVLKLMQWVLKKWLITCPANYVGGGLITLVKGKESEIKI